jgi:hypothetical protein
MEVEGTVCNTTLEVVLRLPTCHLLRDGWKRGQHADIDVTDHWCTGDLARVKEMMDDLPSCVIINKKFVNIHILHKSIYDVEGKPDCIGWVRLTSMTKDRSFENACGMLPSSSTSG